MDRYRNNYFILTRIFGHSATDLTIMISLFTFLGGVVFRLTYFVFDFNKDFGEFKVKTMNSFGKLKNDTNLIQDDIDLIKSKLNIK